MVRTTVWAQRPAAQEGIRSQGPLDTWCRFDLGWKMIYTISGMVLPEATAPTCGAAVEIVPSKGGHSVENSIFQVSSIDEAKNLSSMVKCMHLIQR